MLSALRAACVLWLTFPVAALAQLDYTYAEGGFVNIDLGAGKDDAGLRLAGSFDLGEPLAVIGEYADVGQLSQLTAGLQISVPIEPALHFTTAGSLERLDTGREADTGAGIRAGLRWLAITAAQNPGRIEFAGELRHLFGFDDFDSLTALRGSALFRLATNLDVQGALQAGDDDRIEIGLRYSIPAALGHRL